MNIKTAESKDIEAVKELWNYSFSDSLEFVEYYFGQRHKLENNLILKESASRIEASLQMHPYSLMVDQIKKEVKYIVGVTVQPESRGKGYSSKLIKNTLNYQYNNGEDISILMPIDTDIYTRYGYTNCFYRYEYHVELSHIKAIKTSYNAHKENISAVMNYKNENTEIEELIQELEKFYNKNISDKHSYIIRNREYFINKFQELTIDGGHLFTVRDSGKLRGFMMLIPKYKEETGLVLEMMFEDVSAFHSLMGIIRSHITQFKKVEIATPQHELFNNFIDFDNKYKTIRKSFMMARIINAKNILKEIVEKSKPYKDGKNFAIKVVDPFIEANNETVEFNSKKNGEIKSIPFLIIGISDLTGLYMKSKTLKNLEKSEDFEFESEVDQHLFIEIFGDEIRENYVNDFI